MGVASHLVGYEPALLVTEEARAGPAGCFVNAEALADPPRGDGLVVVGSTLVIVTMDRRPVGFVSLERLVKGLAAAIEERDEDGLARLCHEPFEAPFERLASQHATLNHVTLLHENRAWKSVNAGTLGGHGSRYGYIHIDCVKQLDGRWYLKRIRPCR